MMHIKLPLGLLAFAATASIAAAQTRPIFSSAEPSDLAWPTQWAPAGAFTRTAVGEFMGDGMRDAVTLAGTLPVILANPAYYNWQHALPVVANDLDVAAGAGLLGRDAVAVVNATGLEFVYLNASTPGAWIVEDKNTLTWKNARKVRCGNIDGLNGMDCAGIGFDPSTLVRYYAGATIESSVHTNRPVVDLAFVQWDADLSMEIALMYADGVEIFDSNGTQFVTPLANFPLGPTVALTALAPATNLPGGLGRVAVIYANGTNKNLITLSPTNPVSSTIALPSPLAYCGIASGDVDSDGDSDLVLTHGRVYAPYYLPNDSPAEPCFQAPASWPAQVIGDHASLVSGSAGGNAAQPVFADLTGDGRADLLLPMQKTTTNPSDPQPAHLFLEAPSQSTYFGAPPALFRGGFQSGDIGGGLRRAYVRIDVPQIDALTSLAANGCEVTVWRQTYFGATISTAAVYRAVHPLTLPGGPSSTGTLGYGFDFVDSLGCFDNLYWIQVVPVHFDPNSPSNNLTVSAMWRPFFGALATHNQDVCVNLTSTGELPFLMDGQNPPIATLPTAGYCGPYSCILQFVGTTPAAAVVGRRRLPPLTAGSLPGNAPHVRAIDNHTLAY